MPGSNIGNIFGTIRMKNDMLKRDLRESGLAVRKFTLTSSTQMKTLGASVVGVSKKLFNMRNLLIGGGAFLIFRSAIKEAAAFENALTKVATLVDDTSLVFGEFKQSIKEMSLEFGQSKETLSKGLFDIISATIDTADAMNVLSASTKLAVAGFTETGTATSAIITTFQTYKDELKGATDASDLLFATMKRGRLTVEDVASNIGVVASVAKGAGVSVEDLSAAFSSISRSGVGAQKTVVQLLAFINSFTGANDDARDAAKSLGVEMSATSIAGGKLIPTVLKMRDALNKMSVDMKANTIKAMFPNRRAQQAFNTLLIQGESTLEDYRQALNRSGLTQEALEKVMGKSAFQFMRFREAVKALMDALGEGLLPIITDVTEGIADFVKSMEESGVLHSFTKEVRELGRQFGFVAKQIILAAQAIKLLTRFTPSGLIQHGITSVLPKPTVQGIKGFALPEPGGAGADPRGIVGGLKDVAKNAELTTDELKDLDKEINQKGVDLKKLGRTGNQVFKLMENAVTGWASGFSSSLTDVLFGAEITFGSIAESFARMITEMFIQLAIIQPLMQAVLGAFGGGGGINFANLPTVGTASRIASGQQGVIGTLSPLDVPSMARGGTVPGAFGQPTLVMAHGGEEITPLSQSGRGSNVEVNIFGAPEGTRVEEGTTANGGRRLDVIIDEQVAENINRAGSRTSNALKNSKGVTNTLIGR